MSQHSLLMVLFFLFALGLPLWAMQVNDRGWGSIHGCTGECYEEWQNDTGGVVQVATARAAARAEATPEELGRESYTGCIACHGVDGEGGVGPQLRGNGADTIKTALLQYRNGETRGSQSSLMWGQAKSLTDQEIEHLAAFVESL